jgi:Protein of unknown function (DUF2971)
MRLFKYVATIGAATAMAGGSLKFTPIGQLNDPMEVLPIFDEAEVEASLNILRRDGCTEDQFRWMKCQQALLELLAPEMIGIRVPDDRELVNALYRSAVYEHLPFLKRMLIHTIGIIRSKVGVLSLSERAECVPMWAHYANGAAGFVIALDGLEQCFAGDRTGSLNMAKAVDYSNRFLGMTFDPSSQDRLFFSKLDDWSYEKEWRVVRALDQCRKDGAGAVPLHLHDIPGHHVSAVICGWNVTDDAYGAACRDVAAVNDDAVIVRTKIEEGRIVFDPPLPAARQGDAGDRKPASMVDVAARRRKSAQDDGDGDSH